MHLYGKTITVEPVVLLYVFAVFAEYAVVEDLIYVSNCARTLNLTSNDQIGVCVQNKKKAHNDSDAQIWKGISTTTNHDLLAYNGILFGFCIVTSFISAAYSDRRTKLAPILMTVIGSAIVQLVLLCTLLVPSTEGIAFIFENTYIVYFCAAISGASGGTSVLLSNCFAHVAEKCTPDNRTSKITIVEACLFFGGFLGFTYAGFILRSFPSSMDRYYFSFGAFLITHVMLVLYILRRRRIFWRPHNDTVINTGWRSVPMLFTSVLRTIFRKRPQRKSVLLILAAFVLISFWNTSVSTIMFIFTRNEPLHWESWKYSYFNSAKFALCGVFLCLLPVLQNLRKTRFQSAPLADLTIIQLGLVSRGLSIIVIGLATNTTVMLCALIVIILAEYPIPAIRSLLTKIIDPDEKTQTFVFLATIQSLCFFVGGMLFPVIYNIIYNNVDHSSSFNSPGLIFIAMGCFQFVALFIFRYVDALLNEQNNTFNVGSSESDREERMIQ